MESLLNQKEAASFLGVSEKRLKELVDAKVVPAYMIAGSILRFREEEIKALKDMFEDNPAGSGERAFHQAFSEVRGFEKLKEALRANDIYLIIIAAAALILVFMFFRLHK